MLNSLPLLRLLFPFVVGIVLAIYLPTTSFYPLFIFGTLFISFLSLVSIRKINNKYSLRWFFGILIHLNLIVGGYALTCFNNEVKTVNLNTQLTNQYLIAEITEPIVVKENSVKIILAIQGIKTQQKWESAEGKAIVYLQKDSNSIHLQMNDVISFEPKLKNVSAPQNPHEFDYRRYLAYHLIHQQAYLSSSNWKLLKKSNTTSIFARAATLRKNLIKLLEDLGVKEERLSVASALILGYKDDIDAQLKSAYSSAGAMHVLAVSGLHVGVIFLIFNQLLLFLNKIKYGKYVKGILLILILWVYALLTGLSPSVMRAATMFSFIVGAKITGIHSNFFNTLAASALTLLLINPLLIMEVGFQLSYLAVIGIVVIQPWIYNLYYTKWWLLDKIWGLTAVSIAAQIATFPLGLYYFHQFPNYFLLSNLLIIPLAILILYWGLLVIALSPIPQVATYFGKALDYIILFLNESVMYIDQIPYSLSQNIKFTIFDNYLTYIAIISVILLIHLRKYSYFLVASCCVIVLLSLRLLDKNTSLNQRIFTVYNIPAHTAINFIDGTDNILISDLQLLETKEKLLFHVQNNWIQKGVETEKIVTLNELIQQHQISTQLTINNDKLFNKRNYFQFYDKRIALITKDFKLFETENPLKVDYLIVSQNTTHKLQEVLKIIQPLEIIIDASNSHYVAEKLRKQALELELTCWSIPHDGAFVKDLALK